MPTTDRQGRRQDLDLVRTAVVGGLIFYHTALIFGPVDFYVNNRPPSYLMTLFVFFAALFGMPLLFVVAGAGAWHSLRRRTAAGFVRERLSRLLVPLVVGVVVVVPPQVYYALRAENENAGSYWRFLTQFFDVRLDLAFPSVLQRAHPDGLFTVAHLWFLFYLLIYSLLLLPLFLGLRRESGKRLIDWLAAHCRGPSAIVLLALPVILIETSLGTWGPGGWNSYSYVPFLVYGFLMAADARLDAALRGLGREATLIGLATLVGLFMIAHYDLGGAGSVLGTDYNPWSVVWRLLKAVGGWAWTLAMLGLGDFLVRHRPRRARAAAVMREGRFAGYAREAVLPFYVLHQTPIVIIGFYVVRWDVGLLVKYLTISISALVATVVVYDLCVRRTAITRALFGMPPAGPQALGDDRPRAVEQGESRHVG